MTLQGMQQRRQIQCFLTCDTPSSRSAFSRRETGSIHFTPTAQGSGRRHRVVDIFPFWYSFSAEGQLGPQGSNGDHVMMKKSFAMRAAWGCALYGIVAIGISGPAWAKPVAIKPGLWKWTFRESSSMGTHMFSSAHCARTASESDLLRVKSGPAGACFRHEHATSGPGGSMIYTFACRQSTGPVETSTRGRYVLVVAPDHLSVSLNGHIMTRISGATSMRFATLIRGTGRWVGACH